MFSRPDEDVDAIVVVVLLNTLLQEIVLVLLNLFWFVVAVAAAHMLLLLLLLRAFAVKIGGWRAKACSSVCFGLVCTCLSRAVLLRQIRSQANDCNMPSAQFGGKSHRVILFYLST